MTRNRNGIRGGITGLNHWVWALPILLALALLGIRGVDLYPPRTDEFISMVNVGWIVDGPYTPIDALHSLAANSPDHTPLYFLLLNIWGHLVGADIATGRLLSVFAGLLSAAMIYRLTRDFVSPMAGVFAVIILASNTFFNFYLVYLRMYPLLVLNATTCLLALSADRTAEADAPAAGVCRARRRLLRAGEHSRNQRSAAHRAGDLSCAACAQGPPLAECFASRDAGIATFFTLGGCAAFGGGEPDI